MALVVPVFHFSFIYSDVTHRRQMCQSTFLPAFTVSLCVCDVIVHSNLGILSLHCLPDSCPFFWRCFCFFFAFSLLNSGDLCQFWRLFLDIFVLKALLVQPMWKLPTVQEIHETCVSVAFYFMKKNSYSDISRKGILPNMIRTGTAPVIFGKIHFLIM